MILVFKVLSISFKKHILNINPCIMFHYCCLECKWAQGCKNVYFISSNAFCAKTRQIQSLFNNITLIKVFQGLTIVIYWMAWIMFDLFLWRIKCISKEYIWITLIIIDIILLTAMMEIRWCKLFQLEWYYIIIRFVSIYDQLTWRRKPKKIGLERNRVYLNVTF